MIFNPHRVAAEKFAALQDLSREAVVAALANSGYLDEDGAIREVRCAEVMPSSNGRILMRYQICFYDENEGELALGNVFIEQKPDGRLYGEY